ncbi:hypothetical protein ACHAPU_004624 [Fusarium lateritium]
MSSWTPINRPVKPKANSSIKSDTIVPIISNNTNTNTMGISGHGNQLQAWQAHALQSGRTPLPESSGERPWLSSTSNVQITCSHGNQLQPWQVHALQNGRTPLPDSPGEKRWTNLTSVPQVAGGPLLSSSISTNNSSSQAPSENGNNGTTYFSEASHKEEPTLMYRFWTEDEMRYLITLRNSGVAWPEVYVAFSHRTPEAIKQAYHKRRHAVERMMEMEAAAASSNDNTNTSA